MTEVKIEQEFKKYKSRYIRLLGNHALSNEELDEVCKSLFGAKYRGTFAQDSKFQLKPGFYIINTDIASGDGIHWCGLILTAKTAYVYDSFARDPDKILPILTKRLRLAKYKIQADRKDKEQKAFYKQNMVVTCGHACLSFLLCAHKHGIRAAMKI
jgi:hypothetical protein